MNDPLLEVLKKHVPANGQPYLEALFAQGLSVIQGGALSALIGSFLPEEERIKLTEDLFVAVQEGLSQQ